MNKRKRSSETGKNFTSNFFLEALVLIGFKQTYLFLRNLYGLVFHPSETTTKIFEKPSWFQALLIFGLPVYLWVLFLIFFIPVFFVFRNYYDARMVLLLSFFTFSFLIFILGCYLLFWVGQYLWQWKLKQKNY